MMPERFKITSRSPIDLVYERQWSSLGNLVSTLQEMGNFGHLYGGFPKYRYRRMGIPGDKVSTYPVAALWNHLAHKARIPKQLLMEEAKWVGNWTAKQHLAPVVIANGTAHRFLFPKLKSTGRLLILERGSTHPIDLYRKPQQARKEAGLSYDMDLPEIVLDEISKTELANFILAGSDVIKNSYVKHGFPENRIYVASYGVDTEHFTSSTSRQNRIGPIRIGIVGIVSFRKGVHRALLIGEWAKSKKLDIEFHFAGPIADREALSLIQNSAAETRLHGVLKGQKLVSFLDSCDAICLPSYEEGFGISVPEGMSMGLPAIVSEEAGCSEAVSSGINGIVVKNFTEESFDEYLTKPLTSRSTLCEMGTNARQTIHEKYTVQHSRDRIRAAINSMMQAERTA